MWCVQIEVPKAELRPVAEIGNILLPALPVGLILGDVRMSVSAPVSACRRLAGAVLRLKDAGDRSGIGPASLQGAAVQAAAGDRNLGNGAVPGKGDPLGTALSARLRLRGLPVVEE